MSPTTPTKSGASMPPAPANVPASDHPATERYDAAVLNAMACDIGARPKQAPHFDDVANALRAVRREPGALIADFDLSAAAVLEEIIAAERLCCASMSWHLERSGALGGTHPALVQLRVEGETDQLDALALLFTPPGPPSDAPHAAS